MGITGLLPFLKAIQREIHLSSFRGKKAAVDSYCWLHKGAYSCAMQLIMGTANVDTLLVLAVVCPEIRERSPRSDEAISILYLSTVCPSGRSSGTA